MPLLIDTYNVLHVPGVLPPDLAGIDTAGLLRLILASRYRRERAILVCDGNPPPGGPVGRLGPDGRLEVQYSGTDATADDAIERLINLSTEPRRLTVISSDRRHVLAAARRRRCRTLSSEQFLAQLAADHHAPAGGPPTAPPPQTPLSRGEVRTWIDTFGLDGDELAARTEEPAPPAPPSKPTPSGGPRGWDPPAQPSSPEPPAQSSTPDPPLIPRSILAEALEMAAAHQREKEQEEALREAANEGEDGDEASSDGVTPPAADAPPPGHPWGGFLTPEMIAEAERTEEEMNATRRPAEPRQRTPDHPADQRRRPPKQPPRSDAVPPDVLDEAEALWREAEDDGDPA